MTERQLAKFVFFVHLWFQYSKNASNYKNFFFCDVNKIVLNLKCS